MKRISIAVIGGGISGLSAGFFIRQKFGPRATLTIYERDHRLGGTIGTTRENGFLADWGPNGFLDREPLTLEFIKQIGLEERLLPSNEKSEKRFIYRREKLWEISANPMKFLASGLLSLRGRLRIAGEYFVPARTAHEDESIFNFAARRIGREAAETLIDPMVSGIYGGDPEMLSLGACFPVMEKMEKEYGGLIKAMIKKKRKSKEKSSGPAGPSGHLTSFRGGLFTLVEQLETILRENIRQGDKVRSIVHVSNGQFRVVSASGIADYDRIIIAAPSNSAAKILEELTPETADLLNQIPYSNLAVVCHGYRVADIGHPIDGFGFLVPHNQKLDILGSIWTSVIFPEQAPDGYALFRTMLGGAKNNEIITLGESRLTELAHQNLARILDIKNKPAFQKVFIWKEAIPQYVLGHRDRLQKIENNLIQLEHIYLAGNAYTGIGLNDAIKRSHGIVDIIAAGLSGQ
jgi:protoporphyrinogen/coproporphyrinogen III oxidase